MGRMSLSIQLTEEEHKYLSSLIKKGTLEARVYKRAKILLLKSQGMSNEAIADKLDTTVPTVRLCLDKFNASGVQCALEDAAGRGRKVEIFDDSKAWVVNIACQKPTAFGLSAELWYPTSLTKYVNSVAEQEGHPRMRTASVSTIRKILRDAQVNPHRITYYCEKRDPDFDKKCTMSLSFTSSWNYVLMKTANSSRFRMTSSPSIHCHTMRSPGFRP